MAERTAIEWPPELRELFEAAKEVADDATVAATDKPDGICGIWVRNARRLKDAVDQVDELFDD